MDKSAIDRCLVGVSKGDNDALLKLYEGTKKGIYAFLYSFYQNVWDTENAMQTVYLKVKQNAHSYKHGTDGRAWLFQVAKNLALNEIKKLAREKTADTETLEYHGGKSETASGEVFEAINKALSEVERQIVILHVLWGYKHREIAKELDMPLGTVLSKYKTSIAKLQNYLKKGEE